MLPFSSFIITLALLKLNDCRGFNASILDLLKGSFYVNGDAPIYCGFLCFYSQLCCGVLLTAAFAMNLVFSTTAIGASFMFSFFFFFEGSNTFFVIFHDFQRQHVLSFSCFFGHFGLDVCLPFKNYMVALLSMLPVFIGGGNFLCRNSLGFLFKDYGCSFQRWNQLCCSLYLLKTDLVVASLHILQRHLCFFCSLLSCSFAIDLVFFNLSIAASLLV